MLDANRLDEPKNRTRIQARLAFVFGLGSLLMLALTTVLGVLIESFGIVNFFGFIAVLAVAAIVLGLLSRQKTDPSRARSKLALAGLIMGSCALFLMIAFRVAIFLIFIPMLGR